MKRLTKQSRAKLFHEFAKRGMDIIDDERLTLLMNNDLLEPVCMALTLSTRRSLELIERDENGKES